jgi:hypothetical protein
MSSPRTTPSPLATLRTMISACLSGVFFLVVAVYFVLGDTFGDPVPVTSVVVVLLVAAADALALSMIGYRVPAIAPGTPSQEAGVAARRAYSSSTYVRMALSEAVAIISLALAFVVTEGGYVVFLVGAALAMVLMAVHAWPGERTIAKVEASLEREGAHSHLREAIGA